MDIQYYGANCIKITTKTASIVIDDNIADLGLKSVTKDKDIALCTGAHADTGARITIDTPGEYEVSDVSIRGLAARAHIDEKGQTTATIYRLITDDIRIAVVGHIYPEINEEQLEALGTIDILIVPVGGNGYTLDPVGAHKVIRAVDPKLVIPTHYNDSAISYPVPQKEFEDFKGELSLDAIEPVAKFKVKPSEFTEAMQVVLLERQ